MENVNINDMIAHAVEMEDQSVEQTSYTDELIEAGTTVGRMVEYIELGKHKQGDYQGKAKPDAEMVRITFELLHPTKNMRTYTAEGVEITAGQLISVRVKKSLSDKAKFKKLFNKMAYGRDIKHMAQMLGEAFVMQIYHNVVKVVGQADKTYANIDKDGEYGIGAPFAVDAMTQAKTAYSVPPATRGLKIFLWQNPSKPTWDSLFIDGTREKKNTDGTTEQISKNWLQEVILSATNYTGSMLHALLGGVVDLPMVDTQPDLPAAAQPDLPAAAQTPVPAAAQDTVAPLESKTVTVAAAADDALAALGLVAA